MSVSILVVDDETDVAELFRQHFRREARQGTYVLHFAYSGKEALEKLCTGIEPQLRACEPLVRRSWRLGAGIAGGCSPTAWLSGRCHWPYR